MTGPETVALIGAGQIGSRYLQGLASVRSPLRIFVVEPDSASQRRAAERWEQVVPPDTRHTVTWLPGVNGVPGDVWLAIVATTADTRRIAVERLKLRTRVSYWILEKVLAQSTGELDRLGELVQDAQGAWVNFPHSTMSWYREIKAAIYADGTFSAFGGGGAWDLACNSVHYLYLMSWLTRQRLTGIDGSGLKGPWFATKRPGYFDTHGVLSASYSNGGTLELTSKPGARVFTLQLQTADNQWTIDDASGLARDANGNEIRGTFELQSGMTTAMVDALLGGRSVLLPTFADAAAIHRPFLEVLLAHWRASGHDGDGKVSIT